MENPFECPICFVDFDGDLNIPTCLNCGHSLCISHISFLENCPICRQVIEGKHKSKPNYSLISAGNFLRQLDVRFKSTASEQSQEEAHKKSAPPPSARGGSVDRSSHVFSMASIAPPALALWRCATCTFDNHTELDVCEMCEQPKAPPSQQATLLAASSAADYGFASASQPRAPPSMARGRCDERVESNPLFSLTRTPSGDHEYSNISSDHETLARGTTVRALYSFPNSSTARARLLAYDATVVRRIGEDQYEIEWDEGHTRSIVATSDMRVIVDVREPNESHEGLMDRLRHMWPWERLKREISPREQRLLKGPMMEMKQCGHSCSPSSLQACCPCSDKRPMKKGNTYPEYKDGAGWTNTASRSAGYCPVCVKSSTTADFCSCPPSIARKGSKFCGLCGLKF